MICSRSASETANAFQDQDVSGASTSWRARSARSRLRAWPACRVTAGVDGPDGAEDVVVAVASDLARRDQRLQRADDLVQLEVEGGGEPVVVVGREGAVAVEGQRQEDELGVGHPPEQRASGTESAPGRRRRSAATRGGQRSRASRAGARSRPRPARGTRGRGLGFAAVPAGDLEPAVPGSAGEVDDGAVAAVVLQERGNPLRGRGVDLVEERGRDGKP